MKSTLTLNIIITSILSGCSSCTTPQSSYNNTTPIPPLPATAPSTDPAQQSSSPETLPHTLHHAYILLQQKQYHEARTAFQELLTHDPNNTFYQVMLARCTLALGDYKTTETTAWAALKNDINNTEGAMILVIARLQQKTLDTLLSDVPANCANISIASAPQELTPRQAKKLYEENIKNTIAQGACRFTQESQENLTYFLSHYPPTPSSLPLLKLMADTLLTKNDYAGYTLYRTLMALFLHPRDGSAAIRIMHETREKLEQQGQTTSDISMTEQQVRQQIEQYISADQKKFFEEMK